jgi:zinc protease
MSYNVGSIEEPSGKEGMAHLLEHMMFLGSNRYSKDKFSEILKNIGASYNAYTSYDITLYHFSVPSMSLEEVMKIESDRIKWLVLDEKAMENEKKVVNEERNMQSNSPYSAFYNSIVPYLYPTTNYGRSVIGYEEDFNKITINDLKTFYNLWYNPNNAKLFISGDINFDEVEKLVKKYYGSIDNSTDKYAFSQYKEKKYKVNIDIEYTDSRINQNLIRVSYLVPSLISDESNNKFDSYSLMILDKILSSKSGDMYKYFVINKKLATEISVSYDYSSRGNTTFDIFIVPKDNVDIQVLKKELVQYLYGLSDMKISDDIVVFYARQLRDNNEYLKENNEEYIFNMAKTINSGLNITDFLGFDKKIIEIRANYLNKVIKNLFTSKYIVSIAIKDNKQAQDK